MDLKQLEYFVAICEELSFSRAAERVGISQPSVSQAIRSLEVEVGTKLFDRLGKKIVLTKAGHILLARSRNIFQEIQLSRTMIQDLNGLQGGTLRVGALSTLVTYLLPHVLMKFHERYPQIQLTVVALGTDDIGDQLLSNEIDLGLTSLPLWREDLETIPLYVERFAMAVPAADALAEQKSATLELLKTTPSVLLPSFFAFRRSLGQLCEEQGFQPMPRIEVPMMDFLLDLVARGTGVTVLPAPYLNKQSRSDLYVLPFEDAQVSRQIGVAYRKNKCLCAATHAFMELLKSTVALAD